MIYRIYIDTHEILSARASKCGANSSVFDHGLSSRYRAEKEKAEAEEAERISERLECLARVVTRLSEAPPGAPGPPAVLSYEEAPTHVHAEPAESYEEELMDDLQDRMALVDAGSMKSDELAEYCALFLRGEHDGQYCSMAGEEAFNKVRFVSPYLFTKNGADGQFMDPGCTKTGKWMKIVRISRADECFMPFPPQAKEVRALGELDLAMKHLKKARSAFTNAGQLGEKRMWDVQSLEKAVSNEVHQLGVAVSLHKKAKAAVESGTLVQVKSRKLRFWAILMWDWRRNHLIGFFPLDFVSCSFGSTTRMQKSCTRSAGRQRRRRGCCLLCKSWKRASLSRRAMFSGSPTC